MKAYLVRMVIVVRDMALTNVILNNQLAKGGSLKRHRWSVMAFDPVQISNWDVGRGDAE